MNREELIDKLNDLHNLLAKSDLSQDNYNKATSILSEIKTELKNNIIKETKIKNQNNYDII